MNNLQPTLEKATLAAGCFWCTEAIFKRLRGVSSVTSGYSGGTMPNPSYNQVSGGATGHAEAIQLEFDPAVLPYDKLLEIFFHTHNPCTANQQGADVGTQYRSVIFYHSEEQQKVAEAVKAKLQGADFKDPIVTEIVPFEQFYKAEDYHQEYYEANQNAPYCTFVIDPKLKKLLEQYKDQVKEEYRH